MRICLLSREYPPDTGWGGVGTYTYHIAHGLVGLGHEVHVVALAAKGQPDSDLITDAGIHVHRVNWHGLLDELNLFLVTAPTLHFVVATGLPLWKRFLELHNDKPFDVVEAPEHLAPALFNSTTAVAPLVIKLHTPHSKFIADNLHLVAPTFDHQMVCLFENVAMTSADLLCSPSLDMSNFVAGTTGIACEKIITARNPVDIDRFTPAGARYQQFDNPTALLVGRLEQRKGVTHFIDAVPLVVREVPNAHFLIVGADTDTAPCGGSMLAYLQRRLREEGCEKHVTFLSHVSIDKMPDVYRSADICVIPSLYDNAPYSCIEAMSCGLPVIASSAGGTKEYISEGEWGFVVPTGCSQSLARAIACLLKDGDIRQRFGTAARKHVEHNLSRRIIATQMEQLYASAIDRWQSRSPIYQKSPSESLPDALQLACAFDTALFEAMCSQSAEFSVRHSARFAIKRPKLFFASVLLSVLRFTNRLIRIASMTRLAERLESSIADKQSGRYELARTRLGWVSSTREYVAQTLERR
jgi:glycosyltransferase involved in cell wall biosynthesis